MVTWELGGGLGRACRAVADFGGLLASSRAWAGKDPSRRLDASLGRLGLSGEIEDWGWVVCGGGAVPHTKWHSV